MAKAKRISDFAKLEDVRPPLDKPEQHLGEELVIQEIERGEGTFGDYAIITVSYLEGTADETFKISCGGKVFLKQIALAEQAGLPVQCKFAKSGRQIYME